jgi:hypothetical protein
MNTFKTILNNTKLQQVTKILVVIWFTAVLGFYSISFYAHKMKASPFLVIFGIGLADISGVIVFYKFFMESSRKRALRINLY